MLVPLTQPQELVVESMSVMFHPDPHSHHSRVRSSKLDLGVDDVEAVGVQFRRERFVQISATLVASAVRATVDVGAKVLRSGGVFLDGVVDLVRHANIEKL